MTRVTPTRQGRVVKVGFYGCANGVVRLMFEAGMEPVDGRNYPRTLELDCPACGHRHVVSIMWRKLAPRDKGIPPDATVRLEVVRGD